MAPGAQPSGRTTLAPSVARRTQVRAPPVGAARGGGRGASDPDWRALPSPSERALSPAPRRHRDWGRPHSPTALGRVVPFSDLKHSSCTSIHTIEVSVCLAFPPRTKM